MFHRTALAAAASLALLAGVAAADRTITAPVPPFTTIALGDLEAHATQILVRFDPKADMDEIAKARAAAGVLETVHSYALVAGLECVRVPAGSVHAAINTLNASPAVLYAEFDYIVSTTAQDTPYGIPMVNAPAAWPTTRGTGATVAVLDTGLDILHPDLPAAVLMQSFINGETVDDLHSHGTHCAGTVLALDNTIGVVGVAPSASLMVGKVLSNGGSGPTSGVMAGVQWAADNGANVVSMSLGGGGFSQAFEDICAAAHAADVLVVAAAGNSNSDAPHYPSSYPTVVSVMAMDSNRNKASFSNFGPAVDIGAPGVSVNSSIPLIDVAANWSGQDHGARVLTGSPIESATGQAIYCDDGLEASDFPASVAGNIAHIRRGGGSFRDKTLNAIDAGAVGVIISNNNGGLFSGTLNGSVSVPVIAISESDGDALQAISGTVASISIFRSGSGYGNKSGTSMACPHVAGVAGLLYAAFGPENVTADQVREALEMSAIDLGDPGRDDIFGHGLVDSVAAIDYLAGIIVTCPADWDGSGGVDGDDIAAFFTDWQAGAADIDASGGTDGDDIAFFFGRWQTGC